MKIYKILGVLLLSTFAFFSCDKSELAITGVEGGLIEVKNPSINYVVGNSGPYASSIRVFQGTIKTNKVEIYKTFHTQIPAPTATDSLNMDPYSTKTVPFKTINVDNVAQNSMQGFEFNFNELIDGLDINGTPLSSSDGDYLIGDYWEFQYYQTTSDGRIVLQDLTTKVTVATRFAGKYKFVEGEYYRLGVLTSAGDYWDPEYLIESIDAKTYKLNGVCAWMDQVLYFQIDNDGRITYPAEWGGAAQVINGMPIVTCELNASDLAEVHCGTSNFVTKDDVNGKDKLTMSFGYYTTGSGPRIFYQVMEKIVE